MACIWLERSGASSEWWLSGELVGLSMVVIYGAQRVELLPERLNAYRSSLAFKPLAYWLSFQLLGVSRWTGEGSRLREPCAGNAGTDFRGST